jgi:hypothetical protein
MPHRFDRVDEPRLEISWCITRQRGLSIFYPMQEIRPRWILSGRTHSFIFRDGILGVGIIRSSMSHMISTAGGSEHPKSKYDI